MRSTPRSTALWLRTIMSAPSGISRGCRNPCSQKRELTLRVRCYRACVFVLSSPLRQFTQPSPFLSHLHNLLTSCTSGIAVGQGSRLRGRWRGSKKCPRLVGAASTLQELQGRFHERLVVLDDAPMSGILVEDEVGVR